MVLARACLIGKLNGAGVAGLTTVAGRRLAGLSSGARLRRSQGRPPGVSTAAAPIATPGIRAASSRAAPATTAPTVAAPATKSRDGHARPAGDASARRETMAFA